MCYKCCNSLIQAIISAMDDLEKTKEISILQILDSLMKLLINKLEETAIISIKSGIDYTKRVDVHILEKVIKRINSNEFYDKTSSDTIFDMFEQLR